jgi:hypothetical protein
MGFVAALRCGGSRELHRVGYGKPMSSLLKTLCRWYSTVRGLMKSWAAISGLDRPSPGEPGDLGLSGGELGRGISRACAYALAGGMQLARRSYSEPVGSHTREHLVRGAQLFAGIDAPVLASQPFSVEQVGAAERPADAGAAKPVDRLAIEALGCIAVAQHRARARLDSQRPIGATCACRLRESLEGVGSALGFSAGRGRLDPARQPDTAAVGLRARGAG